VQVVLGRLLNGGFTTCR